jgi:hypothetical protein
LSSGGDGGGGGVGGGAGSSDRASWHDFHTSHAGIAGTVPTNTHEQRGRRPLRNSSGVTKPTGFCHSAQRLQNTQQVRRISARLRFWLIKSFRVIRSGPILRRTGHWPCARSAAIAQASARSCLLCAASAATASRRARLVSRWTFSAAMRSAFACFLTFSMAIRTSLVTGECRWRPPDRVHDSPTALELICQCLSKVASTGFVTSAGFARKKGESLVSSVAL